MKKGFIALSAVFAATFAFSAFAQDAPKAAAPAAKTFTFSTKTTAEYVKFTGLNRSASTGNLQKSDIAWARVRPEFKLADGDSFFSMRLEIDEALGVQPSTGGSTNTANAAGAVCSDETIVEVAWFYAESKATKLGLENLSVRAGFVGGSPSTNYGLWENDNYGSIGASYSIKDIADIHASYNVVNEFDTKGTFGYNSFDSGFWGLIINPQLSAGKLSFFGTYWTAGQATGSTSNGASSATTTTAASTSTKTAKLQFSDGHQYQIGTQGALSFLDKSVNLTFNGSYQAGRGRIAAKNIATPTNDRIKMRSYAFNVSPEFVVVKDAGSVKNVIFGVSYALASGDKSKTGGKNESYQGQNLENGCTGTGSTTLLFEASGSTMGDMESDPTTAMGTRVRGKGTFGADNNKKDSGYRIASARVKATIGGFYTPTFTVAYATRDQRYVYNAGTAAEWKTNKALGFEFDLINSFQLSDSTNVDLFGAMIRAASGYRESAGQSLNKHPYCLGFGLTQKL